MYLGRYIKHNFQLIHLIYMAGYDSAVGSTD